MALPKEIKPILYADYLQLGEDISYEVIGGQIYNMSPNDQSIAAELLTE
jgi:hypothetical protein